MNTKKKSLDVSRQGKVWKTASGHHAATNPQGTTDYFEDQEQAAAFSKGRGKGGSVHHSKVDTSQVVPIDDHGFIKEKPKSMKKESFRFGSRTTRLQRIVQTITESVEMQEAQKRKMDRTPAMGTMAAGLDADDATRYTAAAKPMKARKTDRFGNLMKAKKTVVHDTNSADENIESAQDLIVNMVGVMVGTKMEIQGTKNGKPYTLKIKKIRKDGRDTYETVSGREVEPRAAGTGLQIVDKRGSKVVLDRGTDIYWD